MSIDRETAVETVSHQIASCVHLMLAKSETTVAALKAKLAELPPSRSETFDPAVIDDLLAGKNAHAISCRLMADIGFVLGFGWDFKITKRPDAEEPA